ncbi:hypothetical protein RJ641_006465 [Dillenia turbinata]|uniref:Uncharacterized protein n=1 Tax=Dillenia turbinata TaxID=194707 RepID=A0AAN8VAB9_9MAGN
MSAKPQKRVSYIYDTWHQRDRTSDGRIDDSGGMCHDAPPLGMAEAIDQSPNRPLDHCGGGQGQEP